MELRWVFFFLFFGRCLLPCSFSHKFSNQILKPFAAKFPSFSAAGTLRYRRKLDWSGMVDKCGGEGGVRQPNNNNSNNNNGDNGDFFTVPRGGPLYISNMEGPLTSVPLFQSSILRELQVAIFLPLLFSIQIFAALFIVFMALSCRIWNSNYLQMDYLKFPKKIYRTTLSYFFLCLFRFHNLLWSLTWWLIFDPIFILLIYYVEWMSLEFSLRKSWWRWLWRKPFGWDSFIYTYKLGCILCDWGYVSFPLFKVDKFYWLTAG